MRLLAIGDIHGHLSKLIDLLDQVQPTSDEQLVFLGDYIDRGPESKGVIDCLIDLKRSFPQSVFLRGNHDQMLLDALVCKGGDARFWRENGGDQTILSYGGAIGVMPLSHVEFLHQTTLYFEHGQFVFVHAGVDPDLPMIEQTAKTLMRERSLDGLPDGRVLVVGHTATNGEVLIADDLIMLDTGAAYGNSLSCLDVLTGQIWQSKVKT